MRESTRQLNFALRKLGYCCLLSIQRLGFIAVYAYKVVHPW